MLNTGKKNSLHILSIVFHLVNDKSSSFLGKDNFIFFNCVIVNFKYSIGYHKK